jgi:uncharacterized membrane protein
MSNAKTSAAMPAPARVPLIVSLAAGAVVGLLAAIFGTWEGGPLAGWGVAAGTYSIWTWLTVWKLDPEETARLATREDPGRAAADILLITASIASLGAIGLVLVKAGNSTGALRMTLVASSLASVVLSWVLVHTLFTLRYARIYYGEIPGGIDFNEANPPKYSDFAYVAFTIGMTFQVSDTNMLTQEFRSNVLRHALISFLFVSVIVASTINLMVGLSR